jgi:hypothetical protein
VVRNRGDEGPDTADSSSDGRHPLYYYAGDQQPGDTNGQNLDQFGAEWYVLSPAGKTIKHGATMASTGTSSRGY